jgi:hypothetical protein
MVGLGSFIFDSSKGETPQSIAMKRAIAQQIMGRGGQRSARNTGEGIGNALASIGDGIVANVMNRRANKSETEGQAGANDLYNSIVGGITGGMPMPEAAGELAATNPSTASYSGLSSSEGPLNYRDAIASIESAGSGDYSAVGPTNKKLGRALGRYQIMEANIGPWSKEVLGREVTPEEFMSNPQLQDAIFDGKFGSYVNKYGPSGAAQAWFAGEGGVGKLNRKDVLGTSVGDYTNKFVNAIGGPQVASSSPQAAIEAIAPSSGSVNPMMQDQQPQFDMGRFGDPISLAEMPPSQEQLQGSLLEQQNAYVQAPPMEAPVDVPTMPVAPYQQQTQQQFPPVEVAQSGNGYFPPAPQPSSVPSQAQQQQRLQQLMQAASNPFLNEGQRSVVNMMLQQELQKMDPYRQAQIRKLEAEASGRPSANSSFGNLDAQARAAGLQPNTPEYQQFMLNGGGAPATFRALDMQAQAAGFQPGTPEYNDFMATRGAGLQQEAKNVANINSGGAAKAAIDLGEASIKAGVDAWSSYGKIQSSIANIDEAVSALDRGAQSGIVYNMLPNVTEASASLENAMNRMGLDVIGSVTFGALSEGEMRLAMETAAPRGLQPEQLRTWLLRKRDAQEKASAMLADAAQFLTVPGNTINKWIERNKAAKEQQPSPQAQQLGSPQIPAQSQTQDGWNSIGGVKIRRKQ